VGGARTPDETGISELGTDMGSPSGTGTSNQSSYPDPLITAPKLEAGGSGARSLVDRVDAAAIPQEALLATHAAEPGAVAVEASMEASMDTAIPATHGGSTPPYLVMPNMGYVGLVPANAGPMPGPVGSPMVAVMPAMVPMRAPSPSAGQVVPRPKPIAAARPARLVNYQSETPEFYGGNSMGMPVPECASSGGFCVGGPECHGGGCLSVPGGSYGGGPYGGGPYGGGGFGAGPYAGSHYGGAFAGQMGGAMYENPQMPAYAWPSYASHPNYAAVTYPRQYSPMAWPYIGPFYPYPQVPLGWRKVCLEWDDGWWMLDFTAKSK
jgi:hypothetical protein